VQLEDRYIVTAGPARAAEFSVRSPVLCRALPGIFPVRAFLPRRARNRRAPFSRRDLNERRLGRYNRDMPYNYLHASVGQSALKQVCASTRSLAGAHTDAFRIGTMGPDPYFGDSMPKPLFAPCRADLAGKFHTLDARTLFGAMFALSRGDEVRAAYTLGFLCHFLLDTNAHPYIEARFPGKAHTPAEICFDLQMTERAGILPSVLPPSRFYRTRSLGALDAFHADLCRALFHERTKGVFARSFHKWIAVNTVSFDPQNRKLRFFSALGRAFHTPGRLTKYLVAMHDDPDDRMNLRRLEWRAPWETDRPRTESLPDLYARACAEAPALLDAAAEAMRSGAAEYALSLVGARRMDARPVSE